MGRSWRCLVWKMWLSRPDRVFFVAQWGSRMAGQPNLLGPQPTACSFHDIKIVMRCVQVSFLDWSGVSFLCGPYSWRCFDDAFLGSCLRSLATVAFLPWMSKNCLVRSLSSTPHSCSLLRSGQIFMLTFFVQNPSRLPIYMMADVIQAKCTLYTSVVGNWRLFDYSFFCSYSMHRSELQVARKLAQRLRSFRRYRCISRNMEMRFSDAGNSHSMSSRSCSICRGCSDCVFSKLLPLFFHFACSLLGSSSADKCMVETSIDLLGSEATDAEIEENEHCVICTWLS